jgi:hypothetical protein
VVDAIEGRFDRGSALHPVFRRAAQLWDEREAFVDAETARAATTDRRREPHEHVRSTGADGSELMSTPDGPVLGPWSARRCGMGNAPLLRSTTGVVP